MLGCIHYEWNELATAAQHFTAVVDLRYCINGLTAHHGWLGLAWIQQVQGHPDQAQHQVAALLRFHHELNNLAFLPLVHSFQTRLALQQGDRVTARRWAQTVALDPNRTPLPFPEISQLTRAKILLGQAAPTGAPSPAAHGAEALVALAPLRQAAETTHNTLRLAQPGRFIRTFVDVDLGSQRLAALLSQLAARGVETEYLGQVLAAFPQRSQPLRGADRVGGAVDQT